MGRIYIEWRDICRCIDRICDNVEDADFDGIKTLFLEAPSIRIPEPRKGKWIVEENMYGFLTCECSICGEVTTDTIMMKPRFKFCPMCGAMMEQNNAGNDIYQ